MRDRVWPGHYSPCSSQLPMQTRFDLTQADIPKTWFNLLPDFPQPLPPPLHPGTKQPVPPEALLAIFPENLVAQEMSPHREVEIPEPVRDIYALWRPTPLLRAVRYEKALRPRMAAVARLSPAGTPAGAGACRAGRRSGWCRGRVSSR